MEFFIIKEKLDKAKKFQDKIKESKKKRALLACILY